MSSKKKPNPRKQPATQADVNKAEQRGREEGAHPMFACILTSLKDMHMIENDELEPMWNHATMLLDEIAKGRIKLQDLDGVLASEYDCYWTWT